MSMLTKLLFSAIAPSTLKRFRRSCEDSAQTQQRLLRHIMEKNQDTAFGRKHGFSRIQSWDDFQSGIPLSTYEDLEPYIRNALEGKPRQLTGVQPVFFATTSGTTGKPKFIPVTPESKSAKSQVTRIWLSGLHRDYPDVFSGRILAVVSPETESVAPCGTPCGAESGAGYRNAPKLIRTTYSAPYEIFEIKDYDAKYYALLRVAAGQDVTFLFTCNPSTVLLIAQRMGENTEGILRDVRDGTLNKDLHLPGPIRSAIEETLQPDPERARFLESAAAADDGVLKPRSVWPNLAVIGCWKGGSVGMYLERFGEYFGLHLSVRDAGYMASEHRGSVPLTDEGDAGVLAVATSVYEFYPVDETGPPQPRDLLSATELEQGRQYFIYVTTLGGLYRYDMNDIIAVEGFHGDAPVLRFVQKGKGVVSFTGEKLYEAQVIKAAEQGLKPINGGYEFIAVLGEMADDKPRYVFLVEFGNPPGEDEAKSILTRMERSLRAENVEYATKRDSHRIDTLALRIIRDGEFDRYRRREVEKGKLDGQFKILRLTTDKEFAAEFKMVREVQADPSQDG